MSKDRPGFLSAKDAEKCKIVGPDGGPCPLYSTRPYDTCSVRALIDQSRHSATSRRDAIGAYTTQIPADCPAGYKS